MKKRFVTNTKRLSSGRNYALNPNRDKTYLLFKNKYLQESIDSQPKALARARRGPARHAALPSIAPALAPTKTPPQRGFCMRRI